MVCGNVESAMVCGNVESAKQTQTLSSKPSGRCHWRCFEHGGEGAVGGRAGMVLKMFHALESVWKSETRAIQVFCRQRLHAVNGVTEQTGISLTRIINFASCAHTNISNEPLEFDCLGCQLLKRGHRLGARGMHPVTPGKFALHLRNNCGVCPDDGYECACALRALAQDRVLYKTEVWAC